MGAKNVIEGATTFLAFTLEQPCDKLVVATPRREVQCIDGLHGEGWWDGRPAPPKNSAPLGAPNHLVGIIGKEMEKSAA